MIYRQYYRNSAIFIIENVAGRDVVALRSKPIEEGEPAVAYVPDDAVREMLSYFEEYGFYEHARPRPPNPLKLGALSELTIIDEKGAMTSILRQHGQDPKTAKCFNDCAETYRAVYNFFPPFGQAAKGDVKFGVKRAGFDRGR
jgi:hypothetical protein